MQLDFSNIQTKKAEIGSIWDEFVTLAFAVKIEISFVSVFDIIFISLSI